MAKRKPLPPTQRQLDILIALAGSGVITRRIEGSRLYQLYANADCGDSDGALADALTAAEVTALLRRGWVCDREGWDSDPRRSGGQYIITEAGSELVEAVHG